MDLLNGKVLGRVVNGGFRTVLWKVLRQHRTFRDPYTDRVWHVHLPNEDQMDEWQWAFKRSPWGALYNKGMRVHKFERPENVPPFVDEHGSASLVDRLDRLHMHIPHSTRSSRKWYRN
ncbi:MAG: hypothetical protein Q8P02_04445, partial [Candidatus Micrarchaeota archaeon]|nr:hypothetical protein [Candidatus Micrarchaeota archaeon]